MKKNFLPHEQKEMLSIARNTIENYLKNLPPPQPKCHYPPAAFERYATFICFYDKDKNFLTGYGTPFSNTSLFDSILENTIKAAYMCKEGAIDSIEKLNNSLIAIILIMTPYRIRHWQEIKIHEHGVILHYNGKRSFVMPQGAKFFNWNMQEMIEELCRRAGISSDLVYQNLCDIDVFSTECFNEGYPSSC